MKFHARIFIFSIALLWTLLHKDGVYGDCPRDIDPCSSSVYSELDEPTRSTGYNVTGTNEHDYSITEAWYRSVSGAGGDMPTERVSTGQCNAYAPIWLNESLPSAAGGITDVAACAVFLDDDCVRSYTIPVKNCETYNVYCLSPVQDAFDRYCIGTETECDYGFTSDTGFTPGCEEVVGTTGTCPTNVDPCSSSVYVELHEPTRSTRYNVTTTNEDDYSLSQEWYRSLSGAGGDMPNEVVTTGQCNAYAPIYLRGSFPSESDGILSMVGCASFLLDTCVRYYLIPVRNCGTYNVYCLPPVADAFDRYCMGSELECEDGYTSANGFTPGCVLIEETTESPASGEGSDESDSGEKKQSNPSLIIVIVVAVVFVIAFITVTVIGCLFRNKRKTTAKTKHTSQIQPPGLLTTHNPMRPESPPPPYSETEPYVPSHKQGRRTKISPIPLRDAQRPNTASSLNSVTTHHAPDERSMTPVF